MSNISNAGTMPQGTSRTRFMVRGQMVEVALDWDHIRDLADRATTNKTRRATFGPIVVKVVKP